MAVALTDFSGFCGFRPLPQIVEYLKTVPEFAAVVGESTASSFVDTVTSAPSKLVERSPPAESPSSEYSELQNALRKLFTALMEADPEKTVKPNLRKLVERYQKETGKQASKDMKFGTIEELVVRLNEQFPDDVGAFCSFLLNVVELKKGEAVFLKANEPHAYLSGGEDPPIVYESSGLLILPSSCQISWSAWPLQVRICVYICLRELHADAAIDNVQITSSALVSHPSFVTCQHSHLCSHIHTDPRTRNL